MKAEDVHKPCHEWVQSIFLLFLAKRISATYKEDCAVRKEITTFWVIIGFELMIAPEDPKYL